jgi:uncharacterized membrane protein
MDSLSRLFAALVGAAFGASLLGFADRLAGAVVGGLVALGALELNSLRTRLRSLDEAVKQLRQELQRNGTEEPQRPPEVRQQPDVRQESEVLQESEVTQRPEFRQRPEARQTPQSRPRTLARGPGPRTAPVDAEFPVVRWIREFFMGGNTVVRVGIVILFFGVAFLLRYLAEHTRLPIGWRLSGIELGGLVLLVIGWRLRRSRAAYALALQGGAIGIEYLTVFAGLRLYGILSPAVAFPLLVIVAVLAAGLAVLQDALSLAVLGVVGGFLAPVLASTGSGNHVVLFSYYAVLNAGIVAMAWFKAWRPLNIAGFVFTFGIGTAWGVLQYRPEFFASIEPFLLLFFSFYLAIVVLFTFRQAASSSGFIDVTLVFGTPIVVFALQSALLHDRLLPLAYSALVLSAVYLASAWWLKRRRAASQALLAESLLAIGVGFLTLAVPLALDARWNVAAWALEGAALVWVGCRQRRAPARAAGALLNLACGVIAATQFDLSAGHALLPVADYAGIVLLCVASVLSACTLHRYRPQLRGYEPAMAAALFGWGLWWWSVGGLSEISQFLPQHRLAAGLTLFTVTTLACSELHRHLHFSPARVAALLQLPIMLVAGAIAVGSSSHPAAAGGWWAWPLAFLGLAVVMYRLEGAASGAVATAFNAGATGSFCGVVGWEAAWQVERLVGGSDAWPTTAAMVTPLAMLWLLPRLVTRVAWPFGKNRDAYTFWVGAGLAVYLMVWSIAANLRSTGDFAPLAYCPLLNPLDLGQVCVLLASYRYWRFVRGLRPAVGWSRSDRGGLSALGAVTFLWLNAILLRTLHQWFGVPFGWDALLASTLVQTALSIFWALLAFSTMLVAARSRLRIVWLVGAALLGVVIGKLFLVDLSRVGSIERIVSFVGVGLLMLVVGYFSPLPPEESAAP